jgi:hypothetical protein
MAGKDTTNGSVELQDGRRATLLRVRGVNTDNLSAGEKQTKVRQATGEIENTVAPEEHWWSYYSTTRSATNETLREHRKDRATNYDNDLTATQRDALQDSADWLQKQDEEEYNANERRDYIVVEADPRESSVHAPSGSLAARHKRLKHWGKSALKSKFGIGDGDNGTPPESPNTTMDTQSDFSDTTADGDASREHLDDSSTETGSGSGHTTGEDSTVNGDDTDEALTGEGIEEVLSRRATEMEKAFGAIDGLTVERAGPREHVEVLRAYWTSQPESAEPGLMDLFQRDWGSDRQTPTERMLARGGYDVNGDTVRVGDTYCRTFWISEWPLYPTSMFLDEVLTLSDVDVDVKIHATPINRHKAPDKAKDEALDVDAEGIKREEHTPLSALTIKAKREAYTRAYQALKEKNDRAWYMNGYVTVRAGSQKELNEDAKEVK